MGFHPMMGLSLVYSDDLEAFALQWQYNAICSAMADTLLYFDLLDLRTTRIP